MPKEPTGPYRRPRRFMEHPDTPNSKAAYPIGRARPPEKDGPKPMSKEDVQQAVHEFASDAITYQRAELSIDRATATQYYRGDQIGDLSATPGRSGVVLTDLRDSVLAVLPSLVRLFLPTSGHIIRYDARPKTADQIDQAVKIGQQATEFVNEVVFDQDNNAFAELYAAFKDALVRRVGFIKMFWEDRSTYKPYTAKGCDVNQYEALANDPDVEIKKVTERQDPSGIPLRDVEYVQWRREGVARMVCTPPEEILISRDARNREDCLFMAHRTELTSSQLVEMGVDEDEILEYGGISTEIRQSIEEIARRGGIAHTDQVPQPQLRRHLWIEAYPYLDVDGDGTAELVRVRCLGPGQHVIGDPEPVDERPFALFCPDPEPHVLFGGSFADRVMDLQLMKTKVLRAFADGTADSIFPRTFYMEGTVDREAMESTAISQNVAVRDGVPPAQAVQEMRHEFDGNACLSLLQYLDQVKTQRIGPLPATLDPDSLQSTPQLGVKAVVQAASEQVELIARVFAATGMKQLGRGLLKLIVENQPRTRIVRLRGQYTEVDPRAWDADMDVSVNVALGTQEKLGILAANAAKQEQVLQTLGPTNPLVTVGQLVHSYRTMLEMMGVPDVGAFWNDIPANWQPPPQPPSPDPNMILAQAETTKAQAQLMKNQADFTLKQAQQTQENAQTMSDAQFRAAEIALRREEMHLTDERERDKAEADVAVKIAVANAQFKTQITMKQIDADIATERQRQAAVEPEPEPEETPA